VLAWAVLALSALGLLVSAYFIAVTYRWMRPDPRWMPPVCRMDEGTCAQVVHTPQARVFVLPNSVYGFGWYGLAAAAAAAQLATGEWLACLPLVAIGLFTVAFSSYLFFQLRARLKTHCVLCYTGHALNVLLTVLFGIACFG